MESPLQVPKRRAGTWTQDFSKRIGTDALRTVEPDLRRHYNALHDFEAATASQMIGARQSAMAEEQGQLRFPTADPRTRAPRCSCPDKTGVITHQVTGRSGEQNGASSVFRDLRYPAGG